MSGSELIRLDAATLGAKIAAKEVSSAEATRACLDQIAATDGEYHAFLHVAEEKVLAEAARVDDLVAAGETLPSPLAGCAAGAQGRVHYHRYADHLRVEDSRGLDVAVRRDGHRAAARGRHPDSGQDEHGRVRNGQLDRELRLRSDPQPLEHRPRAGWVGGRQCRSFGGVPGTAGHRV